MYFLSETCLIRLYKKTGRMATIMKIAVITCVNNEEEYAQALSYIDRLHVPDGYELDVIAVREAPSMAAGYQMAMEHTDARYKIYMHQDTFIINREFLRDMLSVFEGDDRIGAIGMVGCDDVPINAQAVAAWNVGCVYHNCIPARVQYTQRAADVQSALKKQSH